MKNLHPFYADLPGVLYDRDHYKIALGQINGGVHRLDRVAKEHVRLLNFADSLFQPRAKRAALGKMATGIKKLEPLRYLEEVRQHLSRLPAIDTSARTLIVCGFPNVGKSSLMNSVTAAGVDVQNYAFTTRALYVGAFSYANLDWQLLDTPGLLDRSLTDRPHWKWLQ